MTNFAVFVKHSHISDITNFVVNLLLKKHLLRKSKGGGEKGMEEWISPMKIGEVMHCVAFTQRPIQAIFQIPLPLRYLAKQSTNSIIARIDVRIRYLLQLNNFVLQVFLIVHTKSIFLACAEQFWTWNGKVLK